MKNTLSNIRGLINGGFTEFHLYSYSEDGVHHEFFAFDKIIKEWSHDIYSIEESEIEKFQLYNEDNLNQYLVNDSERMVEDNVNEDDIISRICKKHRSCEVLLKTSSKDILKDFMSKKSKFENTFLYAVNPNQRYKLEYKEQGLGVFSGDKYLTLFYFNFEDNFKKWIKLVSSIYNIEIPQSELLEKCLTEVKVYNTDGPQRFDSSDYFAFDAVNGYIYKMSSGYDDQSSMGRNYIDIVETYKPKEYISLSEKEM